ncbi:MAG TPA: DNA gyrase modulator, partial [Bryobacteraceae bacterium]|nr:DNA gyrase modulator [Bryobacteraceae bacterium]
MLTRERAHAIAQKVIAFSTFPECAVSLRESEQAFVRFANNGITQAGLSRDRSLVISSTRDQKTGSSETSLFDDASLRAAVARSEELAGISSANQEYVEPLGPQEYTSKDNWDDSTAAAKSPVLIAQVRAAVDAAAPKRLSAAGLFLRTSGIQASANKRGKFGYSRATDARLSTTVRAPDGSSSGWAGQPSVRIAEISGTILGARAAEKCLAWKKPVRLEPGKYTVVLEPTAVSDLVQLLGPTFSARMA